VTALYILGALGLLWIWAYVIKVIFIDGIRELRRANRDYIPPSPLILLFSEERAKRRRRALRRAGIVELEGHPRLGIDKARHIR
jgi:hypothetical protein